MQGAVSARHGTNMPSVAWSVVEGESFSVPFNVSAHSQRLWITADKDGLEHELHVKGTNWVRTAPNARLMHRA